MATTVTHTGALESPRDRRWWILAILSIAQLMAVLDTTVVNIALPSAQAALHFSTADRRTRRRTGSGSCAAGVGVGILYRRFPDRHHLIEALFEERLSTVVALAEQALLVPDGWDGLVWFLDRALSLLMVTVAATATADLAPQAWRRYLVLLLDGMVTARDRPTLQTAPPLTADDLAQVVRGTRSPEGCPGTRPPATPDA